ncbi:hypothetical protein HON22_01280 [Candidatus Peregrinibacteria bacterium]|jgi:hypothetical protein|nr:hypothetical protein [Candidatus Peregrinibacteria bacterium]
MEISINSTIIIKSLINDFNSTSEVQIQYGSVENILHNPSRIISKKLRRGIFHIVNTKFDFQKKVKASSGIVYTGANKTTPLPGVVSVYTSSGNVVVRESTPEIEMDIKGIIKNLKRQLNNSV